VGSLFNPAPIAGPPQPIDFATGSLSGVAKAAAADSASKDLWFGITSTASSLLTLTWAGSFAAGLELWAAPDDGTLTSVDEITLLDDAVGQLAAATGEAQYYLVRVYPLDDANNAGTGSLDWAFTVRPEGLLELSVDPIAYDTLAWLRVAVLSATAEGDVEFYVDGVLVLTEAADESGTIVGFTVPIPDVTAGLHTLTAVDVTSGQSSAQEFEVVVYTASGSVDPPELGPTTPASVNEVIRWVFEQVLPIGSVGSGETYTFPNNPSSMTTPHAPRIVTPDHTVAPDGQPILWEGLGPPVDWSIEGFAFERAHVEALERWQSQNRRFWVVDHLQRAWAVTFEALDWTLVRDSRHPWAARYKAKFFIYEGPVALT
jgi:hypothetical protein